MKRRTHSRPVHAGLSESCTFPDSYLEVATRAWVKPAPRARRAKAAPYGNELPGIIIVFDTETTVDTLQNLTFGVYRIYAHRDFLLRTGGIPEWQLALPHTLDNKPEHTLLEEGTFYADDLPDADITTLRDYCQSHRSDAYDECHQRKPLKLMSRRAFVDTILYPYAVEARALVVGFNLPFDISRIAVDVRQARGENRGGFSFVIWQYERGGVLRENRFRPRIVIKPIDSKRAIIQFRGREQSGRGAFHGHFLDVRTLAFALTSHGYSLASLSAALGVAHAKQTADAHGVMTEAYIEYARRDVLATWECFLKLCDEYLRHPIPLRMTQAYSPASMAKGYLNAMGVRVPALAPDPALGLSTDAIFGACMQAYYGGRAECRMRWLPVPVVYCDFLSMYPTVGTLMQLWEMLTAPRVRVIDATEDIRAWLAHVTPDAMFRQASWRGLTVLVELVPDGDILPVRAQYDGEGHDFQIGVNPVTGDQPGWWTLPDVVASTLLTGRPPRITRALRFIPDGRQPGLQPVRLRGDIEIDPRRDDFFKSVIEQRKSLPAEMPSEERVRMSLFLKILANAGSYGIFVEMNRQEGHEAACTVYDGTDAPFTTSVPHPEQPGPFCFPPLAAFITAGARLMLALLEHRVATLGGSYAFCDTDSMAIAASEHGGLWPCPGGPELLADGRAAVRLLSWTQVQGIVERFAALSPYDAAKIPGSILKIEDINFDTNVDGKRRRELTAFVISAKRYALFTCNPDGEPVIIDAKSHGLGHLLNPDVRIYDVPDAGVRESIDDGISLHEWQKQAWENIVRAALGLPEVEHHWCDAIAMSRITVSKPAVLRCFAPLNAGKPYNLQIKPYNFIMTPHIQSIIANRATSRERIRLIAPFERDARKWNKLRYRNLYNSNGATYTITSRREDAADGVCPVETIGDVLRWHRYHPEAKSIDSTGIPGNKQARGLLSRRPVAIACRRLIGKESNKLEDVIAGLVSDPADVYTTYARPGARLASIRAALGALQQAGVPLAGVATAAGITPRQLRAICAGAGTSPATCTRLDAACRHALITHIQALEALPPAAHGMALDALAARLTRGVDGARIRLTIWLSDRAPHTSERQLAVQLGVSPMSVCRWLRTGPPRDAVTLARTLQRIGRPAGHAPMAARAAHGGSRDAASLVVAREGVQGLQASASAHGLLPRREGG